MPPVEHRRVHFERLLIGCGTREVLHAGDLSPGGQRVHRHRLRGTGEGRFPAGAQIQHDARFCGRLGSARPENRHRPGMGHDDARLVSRQVNIGCRGERQFRRLASERIPQLKRRTVSESQRAMNSMVGSVDQKVCVPRRQLAMHEPDLGRGSHIGLQQAVQRLAQLRVVFHQMPERTRCFEQCPRQLVDLRRVRFGFQESRRQRGSAAGGDDDAAFARVLGDHYERLQRHSLHVRQHQYRILDSHRGDGVIVDEIVVVAAVQNLWNHVGAEQPVHRLIHRIVPQREARISVGGGKI